MSEHQDQHNWGYSGQTYMVTRFLTRRNHLATNKETLTWSIHTVSAPSTALYPQPDVLGLSSECDSMDDHIANPIEISNINALTYIPDVAVNSSILEMD